MDKNPTKSIITWGVGLAAVALFGLIMMVIFGNLQPTQLITNKTSTVTVTNESGAWLNISGYTLSGWNTSWGGITLTEIWTSYPNQSAVANYSINLANATVSTLGVVTNTTAVFNATVMNNVTLSYTYGASYVPITQTQMTNYNGNYTQSLINTSQQFPTVGTILGVALLLIILIAVLVFAVKKMSGVTGERGERREGYMPEGDFG